MQSDSTGGSFWLAGPLWMACGQGFYGLASIGALLALVVLAVLRVIERQTPL